MALSNELISQFVKATQDKEETKKESTAYGKIVKQGDVEYVQLDGSDLLTPISSTTVVKDGDRVIVTIKNHEAIVTGDLTTPAASDKDVKEIGNKISEFEIVIADKVSTEQLEAEIAKIDKLVTDEFSATNAKIETMEGKVAKIDTIEADVLEVNKKITAHEGEFTTIRGEIAEFEDVTAKSVEAIEGDFYKLESDYADFKETTTNKITANEGNISKLQTDKLDVKSAEVTYANIDFSNIKEAAVEKLFTDSGIIKDLIMSDGKVTGELVGVTIKGDLIEGNTLKADKLVILGEDGLYYKLNVDALGETTASSDEKYQNGLDGSVIIAESITAEKVSVDDLVAFGATIGGYRISEHALYSGTKNSVSNTTRGVFLGDDGQMAIGDSSNYLKYFKDTDGQYKLEIQASAIKFGVSGSTIDDIISDAVDGIEIGGRNLLLNTATPIIPDGTAGTKYAYNYYILSTSLEENQQYTISADVEILEGTAEAISTRIYDSTITTSCVACDMPIKNGRVEYVVTPNSNAPSANKLLLYAGVAGSTSGNKVKFTNVKLEKGNKATDWTQAPEDIDNSINNAKTAADNAQTSADVAQENIDKLQVGARNLFSGYSEDEIRLNDYQNTGSFTQFVNCLTFDPCETVGEEYTISLWARSPNGVTPLRIYNSNSTPRHFRFDQRLTNELGDEWEYFTLTITNTDSGDIYTDDYCNKIEIYAPNQMGVLVKKIKVEKGNKATDWTPAPEDIDSDISKAQSSADTAQTSAENAQNTANTAQSTVTILQNMISNLVTDANGGSLMTQTPDGWTFNMSSITGNLEAIQTAMENMDDKQKDTNDALGKLVDLVNSIVNKTAYITISTDDNGDPCIELGKTDNLFKVRITNTAIDFLEGSTKIAYANNNTFYSGKIITKQIQIGEGPGFVWQTRANGNMGLTYISG